MTMICVWLRRLYTRARSNGVQTELRAESRAERVRARQVLEAVFLRTSRIVDESFMGHA